MSVPSVVQAYLNRVSAAFIDDDFDAWAASVSLPLTFVTRTGTTRYETRSHLQADFEEYVALIGLYFITELRREVVSVDQISPVHLIARYTTEVFSGSQQVIAPYPSTAMLQFQRGAWRASAIMGSIGKKNWTRTAPEYTGNVVPFKAARSR